MPEREKYEDGWTDTEKVDGGQEQEAIVNTSPKERGMFNVGVSYKQIKEVADVGEKVVANPDDAATDTLEKIKVGDTTYNIVSELPSTTSASASQVLTLDANKVPEWASVPTGTEVVANPTLAGTEAALEGLQVGSTKYSVDGTQLYLHTIAVQETNAYNLKIISSVATPVDATTFETFIKGDNFYQLKEFSIGAFPIAQNYLGLAIESNVVYVIWYNSTSGLDSQTTFTLTSIVSITDTVSKL